MLFLYTVLVVCCAFMLVAGIIEQRRHFANLEEIPTRVLVNGIRGKSSITRLVAGALRGGGLVTVAKTTGTAARFIHPDATEEPVYRKFGLANVVEQIGIVRRAAAYQPDALVMECMAVMPPLQELNQQKLIQSTIGVLCNVREDHVAEMGPTLDDIGRSLSRSMPVGGICVTAEKDRFHVLQQEADARDCQLIYADPDMVTDEELRGFSWFTFKENVAIALVVADLLGIERQTALQGMYDAPPDPGVLSVERYVVPGDKKLRFGNIFAANDPESTLMNIQQLIDLGAIKRPLNVVINCRPDRVERNGQMGQIVPDIKPEKVFVIGHPSKSAIDAIPAEWRDRAIDLGGERDGEEFMHELLGHLGPDSSLVSIGNIHGQGEILLEHLAELPNFEDEDDVEAALPGAQAHHPRHDQTMALYVKHLDPYANIPAAEEARRMQAPPVPRPRQPQQPYPPQPLHQQGRPVTQQMQHVPPQQYVQPLPQQQPYGDQYAQQGQQHQQYGQQAPHQQQQQGQQQYGQQQRPEAPWPPFQQQQPQRPQQQQEPHPTQQWQSPGEPR
ncbi:poly-gamma-glutamate synthase PgsB [Streptomyces sp. NPDC089919]|uniref:poly-gamma-glutamate synthase PgsB n=1 Tax=Streptomyces sp. NPDC089919 TaxID=3155188 RepID=UPI0034403248